MISVFNKIEVFIVFTILQKITMNKNNRKYFKKSGNIFVDHGDISVNYFRDNSFLIEQCGYTLYIKKHK